MIPVCTEQHNNVSAATRALGFVMAPSIINQDTIPEYTTQRKSLMVKIELHSSEHLAKEGHQIEIVMRLEVHKEVI